MKKKILIISFTSPRKDPRVWKEWKYLRDEYDLTIAGCAPGIDGTDFIEIRKTYASGPEKLLFGAAMMLGDIQPFLNSFHLDAAALAGRKFDLVLCNDLFPLPLAFECAQGAPVFWDAHEYYPLEHEDSLVWNFTFRKNVLVLAKKWIPKVAGMSTVCPAIADRYAKEFGKTPILVRNTPEYKEYAPSKNSGPIRMIHHGDAHPSRKLETLIEMMKILGGDYTLDFMLIAHEDYQKKLKRLAHGMTNIRFLPPVPVNEVASFVNQYDIGLFPIPPVTFNFKYCLPNKFFEYMHACLAIGIGPSPEMAELVRKHGIGIVAEDFTPSAMARAIAAKTRVEIAEMKRRSEQTAELYQAELEMRNMKSEIKRILES